MISLHPLALVALILLAAWFAGWVAARMVLRTEKLIDLMAEVPPEVCEERMKERRVN